MSNSTTMTTNTNSSSSPSTASPPSLLATKRRNMKFSRMYPFVANTYREIRKYLSSINSDMNSQILIRIVNKFKRGCSDIFDAVLEDPELSKMLAATIVRVLDLLKDMSKRCNDLEEFHHRVCELIAFYISCELRANLECQDDDNLLDNIIVYIIRRHLAQEDENETLHNILRTLIYIPRLSIPNDTMCAIFEEFIPLKTPPEPKQLPDKLYMLYIIIFYRWMKMQSDESDQQLIINFAATFMKPQVSLCTNPLYSQHLPKYTRHSQATRTILNQMIYYKDLRNACIIDNAFKVTGTIVDLCDNDDEEEEVDNVTLAVQESSSLDIMDFVQLFAAVQLELAKTSITASKVKHEEQIIVDSVDLTVEETEHDSDDQLGTLFEKQDKWLDKMKTITRQYLSLKEKQQLQQQQKTKENSSTIISLDSDSGEEDKLDGKQKTRSNNLQADNKDLFDDNYPETVTPLDHNSESCENEETHIITKSIPSFVAADNNSLRTYVAKKNGSSSLSSADESCTRSIHKRVSAANKLAQRRNSVHITATSKSPPPSSPPPLPANAESEDESTSDDVEYYSNLFYSSSPQRNMNSRGPGVPFDRLNSTFGSGGRVVFSQAMPARNGSSLSRNDETNLSTKSEPHRTKKVHFDSSPMGPTASYSKQKSMNNHIPHAQTNTNDDEDDDGEYFVPFWQRSSFQCSSSRLNSLNMSPAMARQQQQDHRTGHNSLYGNIFERRPSISNRMSGIGSHAFTTGKRTLPPSRLATEGHRCKKRLNRLKLRRSTISDHAEFNRYLAAQIQNETTNPPRQHLAEDNTWDEGSYQRFLRNEISGHLDVASTGTFNGAWYDDKLTNHYGVGVKSHEEILELERQRNIMYNEILQKQRRKLELKALEKMKEKQRRKQEKQQKREQFQMEQSETMKQLERMNLRGNVTDFEEEKEETEPLKRTQTRCVETSNKFISKGQLKEFPPAMPSSPKRGLFNITAKPDNEVQHEQELQTMKANKPTFVVPESPTKSAANSYLHSTSENEKESSDLDQVPLAQRKTRNRKPVKSLSPEKIANKRPTTNTRSTRQRRHTLCNANNNDLDQTTDSEFEAKRRPVRERRKTITCQPALKRRTRNSEQTTDSEMDAKSNTSLRHSARLAQSLTKCPKQSDSDSVADIQGFSDSIKMSAPTKTGVKRKTKKSSNATKKKPIVKDLVENAVLQTDTIVEQISPQMSEENIVAVIAQRLSSPDTTTILNNPIETTEHEEILETLEDMLAKEQTTKTQEPESITKNDNHNNPQMGASDMHSVIENTVINEIQREMDAQKSPEKDNHQKTQWNIRKNTILNFEDSPENTIDNNDRRSDQYNSPLIISKVQSYASVQDFELSLERPQTSAANKVIVTENIVLRPQVSNETESSPSLNMPMNDLILNLNDIPLLPMDTTNGITSGEDNQNTTKETEYLSQSTENSSGQEMDSLENNEKLGVSLPYDSITKPCHVLLKRLEIDEYINAKHNLEDKEYPPPAEQAQCEEQQKTNNGNDTNPETLYHPSHKSNLLLEQFNNANRATTWSPTELVDPNAVDDSEDENHYYHRKDNYILEEDRSTTWSPTVMVDTVPAPNDDSHGNKMLKSCLSTGKSQNGISKTLTFNSMVEVISVSPCSSESYMTSLDSNSSLLQRTGVLTNDSHVQRNQCISPIDSFLEANTSSSNILDSNGETNNLEKSPQDDTTSGKYVPVNDSNCNQLSPANSSPGYPTPSLECQRPVGQEYEVETSKQMAMEYHRHIGQEIEIQTSNRMTNSNETNSNEIPSNNSPIPVYLFSHEEMIQFTSADSLYVSSSCAPVNPADKNNLPTNPMMSPSEQEVSSSQDRTPINDTRKTGQDKADSSGVLQNNQVDTTNNLPELNPAPTLDSYIASSTIDIAALAVKNKEKLKSPINSKKSKELNPKEISQKPISADVVANDKNQAKESKFKIPKIKRDFNERSHLALTQKEAAKSPTSKVVRNPFVTRSTSNNGDEKTKLETTTNMNLGSKPSEENPSLTRRTENNQKRERSGTSSDTEQKKVKSDTSSDNELKRPKREFPEDTSKSDDEASKRERSATPSDSELKRPRRKLAEDSMKSDEKKPERGHCTTSSEQNKLHTNRKISKRERSATPSDNELKRPKRKTTEDDAIIKSDDDKKLLHTNVKANKRDRSVTPSDNELKRSKRKIEEETQKSYDKTQKPEKSDTPSDDDLKRSNALTSEDKPKDKSSLVSKTSHKIDENKCKDSKSKTTKTEQTRSKERNKNSEQKISKTKKSAKNEKPSSSLSANEASKKFESALPPPTINTENHKMATELTTIPSLSFYTKTEKKESNKNNEEKVKHSKSFRSEHKNTTKKSHAKQSSIQHDTENEKTILTERELRTASPLLLHTSVVEADGRVRKKHKTK